MMALALTALAGTAVAATAPSAALPMPVADDDVARAHATLNVFEATRAPQAIDLGGDAPLRVLGDTYDSETLALNTPLTSFAFISGSTGGQSLPFDGTFHSAGSSVLNGSLIENGGALFDNGDGTITVSMQTRIESFSDGFVPLGFSFGGDPITAFGWSVGDFAPVFDRVAPADPLDPMLSAEFPPLGAFDVVDANIFFFDNGILLGSGPFSSTPFLNQDDIDFLITISGAAGSNIDFVIVEYLVQSATADTEIALEPEDDCLDATENQLVVEINATNVHGLNAGGQFFLQYDQTRLDFVSADAGDAPFTREIYEVVDELSGTIDYAVGVPDGDLGTAIPSTMARITFDVLTDICQEDGLVTFRTGPLPSRITDSSGVDLGAATVDMGEITKDSVPPMIVAPDDIVVNADAGGCTATLNFVEPFDTNPSLCASQTPDCWYTDRYAPAAFESVFFDGDNRLRHGISAADSAANRPPSFSSLFYNTQGRKYDVDIPVGERWSIDLYIPSDWETNVRRADIWATTFDSFSNISGFPILGFTSNDPADDLNTMPANPTPRFRFFTQDTDQDDSNGLTPGWLELGLPVGFSYDRWWTLEVELTASGYNYSVIDDTNTVVISGTDVVTFGSIRAGNLIVQAYNFGETYDAYWDNAILGPAGPVATDDCSDVVVFFERSDNPALGLGDPFPQGTTTITWTAEDACGNSSSDTHTVTVNSSNTLEATVELQATVNAGPFDRCITFELIPTGGGAAVVVEETMTFIGGVATASFDVPCGDYECITARDTLHTLRSTDNDDFAIVGANYVTDFTSSGDGDALIGGNLNDDTFIDILDFGIFASAFGTVPGADTPCGTVGPHADVTGDGNVLGGDFTFIQINFLKFSEIRCDGSLLLRPGGGSVAALGNAAIESVPTESITVEELSRRGLEELVQGDLNNDGVLDTEDMWAFLAGDRPDRLADIDRNGNVDAEDLQIVIRSIEHNAPQGDVNCDGVVNIDDLMFVVDRLGLELSAN